MSEQKKGNGHRPATLDELEKASDRELIEGMAEDEAEHRHLSEAELQRRMNRRVAKLNRRFWMMTGLLLVMNTIMIAVAYVLLRPRIDQDEVADQARELLGLARDYAGRGLEQASELGSVAADHGRDYADAALSHSGRYADIALEHGSRYADVATQKGGEYAAVGLDRAKKEMASLR